MSNPAQLTEITRQWMDVFMHRSMSGWRQYAKATGLSMPQFSLLMRLHYHGDCGISEISEHMDTSNAAASQLVEKLVQNDLLDRTEDPNDRRAKQVKLSAKGREMIKRGISERNRWVNELVTDLDADQRATVAEALVILTEAARKLEQAH